MKELISKLNGILSVNNSWRAGVGRVISIPSGERLRDLAVHGNSTPLCVETRVP